MRLVYSDIDTQLYKTKDNIGHVGKIGDTCNFTSWDVYYPKVTGIDRRTHWEVPDGCRPQLIMMGGVDVDGYYMNDVWFFDIWNATWGQAIIGGGGLFDLYSPAPRKFPVLNVYRPPTGKYHPVGAPFECVSVDKRGMPLGPEFCDPVKGRMYSEMIYVMGGWLAPPVGPIQDVWGYSREYGQWVDLKPAGRVPSARVYDTISFIQHTGYLIGGTFGAFKIDVTKYNVLLNRFSSLYATGAKPSARSFFSTTIYKDSLFVYAGRGWVTVDNMDKEDMWQYNVTSNFWLKSEPTGIIPKPRWGHTMVTFLDSTINFGGHGSAELLELGVGDMDEIWRFEIGIGSLLADSKFPKNTEGWKGFQNEVRIL